jgi:hypothetical protein
MGFSPIVREVRPMAMACFSGPLERRMHVT